MNEKETEMYGDTTTSISKTLSPQEKAISNLMKRLDMMHCGRDKQLKMPVDFKDLKVLFWQFYKALKEDNTQ